MTELNPATFDVEAWLTDAALPEESATVYKRADVISELSDLKRRIEIERDAEASVDYERTATEQDPSQKLERQYEALLKTFTDSALTVYVRALTRDEIKALRDAHDKRTEGMAPLDANVEFGYDLLAASIVGVKMSPAADRQPATFTTDTVKKLEEGIGQPQIQLILNARMTAQNSVPAVDADFLHRPSGTEDGRE